MAARSRQLSDLELLCLSPPGLDEHGRVPGSSGLTIAVTAEGQRVLIGAQVPDELARQLEAAAGSTVSRASRPVEEEPEAFARYRALVAAAAGAVEERAGPYYVFPPKVVVPVQVPLATSRDGGSNLRDANPGNWEAGEWDDLLDGRLGPWAMVVLDGRVVSICHTPAVVTEVAAECGVWTDPAFRARGYAAATAAAWAGLLVPTGRHLFYSTTGTNVSSQRVASRLGLRLLGWTWSVSSVESFRRVSEPGQVPL